MPLIYESGPFRQDEVQIGGSAFSRGDLLTVDPQRRAIPWSTTSNAVLGVALGSSADSIPSGRVQVLIPQPGCRFRADVPTGIAQSSFSFGQTTGPYRGALGSLSYITTAYTTEAHRPFIVVGPIDSRESTVPVEIRVNYAIAPSSTSQTI